MDHGCAHNLAIMNVNRPLGQALFISFKLHSASGDLVPVFWLWLAVAGGRQLIGLDVTPLKSVEKSVSASVRLLYLKWTRTAFVRKTKQQKVYYELTMRGERQETTSNLTLPPYGVRSIPRCQGAPKQVILHFCDLQSL